MPKRKVSTLVAEPAGEEPAPAPVAKTPEKANIEAGTVCVNGLTKKALSNAVSYSLSKAPSHIRVHYEQHLKTAKTKTGSE